jgi:hypothetical protein
MKDGYRSECKACHRSRQQAWYAKNREHAIAQVKRWQQENKDYLYEYRRQYRQRRKAEERDAYLRRTFGITQVDYDVRLVSQGGGCAICGKQPEKISLHVDHDHITGKIRGLLCVGCNNALGQFRDDPALLTRAIAYVGDDLLPLAAEQEITALALVRARELGEVPV